MANSLFHKKIICLHCKGNFKKRTNRKKNVYLCSRRENGYTNCPRIQIDEEFLVSCLNKRYGKELTEEEITGKVDRIEVEDKLLFTIYLTDQKPIVYGKNHIVY